MPDIGPGSLHNATGPFVLSQAGWLAVQAYVTSAMNLPTTLDALGQSLPGTPPGGLAQFQNLLTAYKTMNDHCSFWNTHTLPDSVSCASDVVHYNEKVPIYYGAITKLLPKLQETPPDPAAVAQLTAILASLSHDAQGFADHAGRVKDAMTAFDTQSQADRDAVGTLHTTYNQKLGDESPVITKLTGDIAQDKSDMDAAMDEYHHDVIVAATSAAYAWIWPCGTIAAGVVAGVYGKRATDALAKAKGLSAAIDELSDELRSATILMADLTRINADLSNIGGKLASALPSLDLMRGAWGAISDDLNNIISVIANDIGQAPAILMSLGIDEAIADWAAVAREADGYRVNAFISVGTEAAAAQSATELSNKIARISQQASALSASTATVSKAA